MNKFRIDLTVSGDERIIQIRGRELDVDSVTVGELTELVELIRKIEKLTGLSWQIDLQQV